jgi:predicted phosphoribosyltransferase
MRRIADEVVCVSLPEPFNAVGLWYEDFSQTTDEEVRRVLSLGVRSTGADQKKVSRQTDAVASCAAGRGR